MMHFEPFELVSSSTGKSSGSSSEDWAAAVAGAMVKKASMSRERERKWVGKW